MSLANAMQQFPNRGVKPSGIDAPMMRLAECRQLSPRVIDILQGLFELCTTGLELRISATLNEFEKQLIRLADKATINLQNHYFDSVHALKRDCANVAPRFLRSLEDSLARLGEEAKRPGKGRDVASPSVKLALSDGTQLDESLVLSDISTKVELRVREPLYALGHRFGTLASTPRIPTEVMPLGPRAVAEAMRYGAAALDLPLEHRLVLYRCFERVVMNEIGTLYGALNNFLVERDVLRELHTLPVATGANVSAHTPPSGRTTASANGAFAGPARETRPTSIVRPTNAEPRRLPTALRPEARAEDSFGTMKHLLAACRRAEAYTASGADLQTALATLQVRHTAAAVDEKWSLRSGEQIKQEILALLQEHCVDGRASRIDEEAADTIDLAAMLFEFLSRRARADGLANWILARLQIPVLRAALEDKRFFSERSHPARKLINDLVEAGRFWVDEIEAEKDPTLVDQLQLITNQVAAEYQGNVLVFTVALQELSRHIDALVRKVEVTERRHLEAAIGREKLEYSRLLASAAIAERIASAKPNEFLRTLLERAWIDVLAVSLLRDGEGSSGHARRLQVVDELLALGGKTQNDSNAPIAPELRAEIESGLRQVGLHDDDVRAITQKLLAGADAEQDENPISQTELAIKLKGKARLGGEYKVCNTLESTPTLDQALSLAPEEQAALDRLSTLPTGTWFEFKVNAQGDTVRRKLSWYSTQTDHCLLINQRGVPEAKTLLQLAREMVQGQARLASAEQEPLIDRAWADMGDTLKNYSTPKQVCRFDAAPVAPRALQPASAVADEGVPQHQELRTLLLVDDEENILRALNRVLRGEGYRVLCATSARAALETLGQHEVQVIISDQRMPEVSGTEFLGKVKAIYPDTVRIMLSGYSDAAAVTDAINRGTIYKFLTKPWDDDDIRLQVRDAFRAAKLC